MATWASKNCLTVLPFTDEGMMPLPSIGTIVMEECGDQFYYGVVKRVNEARPRPVKIHWRSPEYVEYIQWPHKYIDIVGNEHTPHLSKLLLRY